MVIGSLQSRIVQYKTQEHPVIIFKKLRLVFPQSLLVAVLQDNRFDVPQGFFFGLTAPQNLWFVVLSVSLLNRVYEFLFQEKLRVSQVCCSIGSPTCWLTAFWLLVSQYRLDVFYQNFVSFSIGPLKRCSTEISVCCSIEL